MLEEVEFQNPWVAYETANNGRTADKIDEKLWNDIACFKMQNEFEVLEKKRKRSNVSFRNFCL